MQADLTQADGTAERRAELDMIHAYSPGSTRQLTLGADKGYDSADFVRDLRQACVTPHVAQKSRHSAIDGRTSRHEGYALSQKHRKRIEEPFGWGKTVGGPHRNARPPRRPTIRKPFRRANFFSGLLEPSLLHGCIYFRVPVIHVYNWN